MPEHQEKCSNRYSDGDSHLQHNTPRAVRCRSTGRIVDAVGYRLVNRDAIGDCPVACARATRPCQDSVNFVTVNLADFAAQSKELESSDFEEIRVKSERALDRRDNVLTTSRRLRVDGFRARADMRASPVERLGCAFSVG